MPSYFFNLTERFLLSQLNISYHISTSMQSSAQELRDSLWNKLKLSCSSYFKGSDQLQIQAVESIVVDVLKEQNQNQIDYVMKNIFRLDVDGSGTVSFVQLGNFLFKRHSGQLSLQRDHKAGKMTRGSQRLMSLQEFNRLLNSAYKFLGIVCPKDVASYIFKSVDTNQDGYITYVEYFKVIELYVCKGSKAVTPPPPPQPQGRERFSKLRIRIWSALRRLYDAYVKGRSLQANDAELKALIFAIVGQLSQSELDFLTAGLLKSNFQAISFQPFAIQFLLLIAELGLSRYSRNNAITKKTLNKDQFIIVIRNSFAFSKLDKFKAAILYKIFAKIDKNNDGLITFDQYLDWVKRFLAVVRYFGDEFYVPEDDDELDKSDPIQADLPPPTIDRNNLQFVFSDYTFARQVRARVYQFLVPYDADRNKLFNEKQIQAALVGLLKENQIELVYVTKNVFRYDRDNNQEVTYDQFTDFCVQLHFGEMAIQRLHRRLFYSRGGQRIMNKEEFAKTLNYALSFIKLQAPRAIVDLLFSEIDLDRDGWITYEVYFTFLKYYFGSRSVIAAETKVQRVSEYESFLATYRDLNPWDRFVRIIIDQLRIIFFKYDYNHNEQFELDQIRDILLKVFNFSQQELEYVLFNYFNFLKSHNDAVKFDQLIALLLTIYFIQIVLHKRYKSKDSQAWRLKKISLNEFVDLIIEACYFITYKPLKDDLVFIFRELDTDRDGYITFLQFSDFIRKYLGNGIDPFAKPEPPVATPQGISSEQLAFVNAIWDELKVYFNKYDNGQKGFLNEVDLKKFVIEVLNETTEKQLNYVFWNLFRVDSNLNKEVDFNQFAPFILNHAGQISLQRFHKEQTKGKNSLNNEELFVILSNAYKFVPSMPKQRPAASKIFARISTNGSLSYAGFLTWIHHALAARYNKKSN